MRAFDASWRILAGAGLLVTIAVTGCSASSPAAVGNGQPSSPSATTAPGTTPAGQPAEPTASASGSATASTGIQNLLVTSTVRSQLTAAYAALRKIPASDVSGTQPNSVYYAYDQATNTYWGKATFVPAKTDPQAVLVGFQDTASTGLFTKVGSGTWQVQEGDATCLVLQFFPKAVLAAWALPTKPPAGESC
jgi:hypothetical protein